MAFYQNAVLNKYLKAQDALAVKAAYEKFKTHFHNPLIQENIRNSKEEQYQGEFLIDLFVNVLGYTKNPTPDFNLTTEYKNVKDSKKADGAIIINDKVLSVIELKGTDTTDLGKIETQAFGYKNNQPQCVYVVTSNFEKLRFYIDNAIEHIEFNLFTLTENDFQLLWLCLAYTNIEKGIPKKIKDESLGQEDIITKKLYNDYSLFKRELHQNLVALNPQHNPLELFNKSQKLLDRFLFLFFAEDRQLLPPNAVRNVMSEWKQLKELDEYKPLYEQFKKHFNYLNTGFKNNRYEIYAYGGGLFQADELLDSVKIDDDLLYRHTHKLSEYDFASEVDVNILGHIFENSLNELDEIKAQLAGEVIDKSKTKRKKDGVFYTPKYITKYIVENTVGKLCMEKKAELQLNEEEYTTDKKRQQKTRQALLDKLTAYRNWLLQLTICDPACGSGAFLNQALDFLINEHRYIDELQAKLFGDALVLSDMENSILENNLFGVDLNEESVEIAKLSLWLRTAQPNRKLNDLNNNIKCGNSLIDDPAVAGDKAFNWEKEFPQVFAPSSDSYRMRGTKQSGFDVVIGNPPYLRVQGLRDNFEKETKLYETQYKSATGRFDIYVLFIEKSFQLINPTGLISFILPHKFMVSDFGEGIRRFLLENKSLNKIVHFGSEMVFNDASTYTCIIGLSHDNSYINYKQISPTEILFDFQFEEIHYRDLDNGKWNFQGGDGNKLFAKLYKQPLTIKAVFENISQGIVSVGDDIFLMKGEIIGNKFTGYSEKMGECVTIEAETVKPLLKGEDVKKYSPIVNSYYCLYPHYEKEGKTMPYEEEYFKEKFPLAYSYILPYKAELIEKKIKYKTNPKAWYSLHRSREMSMFEQVKIITPEISLGTNMTLDTDNLYHNTKCYTLAKRKEIEEDIRFWLTILNSKLLWYFLSSTGYILRGGFFTFKTKYLEPFPLPKLKLIEEQQPFIEKADQMLFLNKEQQKATSSFLTLLQSKYTIEKPTTKLQNWYDLEFGEFLKELKKAKVQLSLAEEAEWMSYFNTEKQKAQALKTQITQTDKEIDRMVYELYGLTEEEIRIVEG